MTKENILVVEDDEDILELITLSLVEENYDVSGVTSGEAALDIIKSYLPDCILLDLMLPGINGFDVCKTLKNNVNNANIPIIMLTSRGSEEDIVLGLEYGADDYIIKPFSPRILAARIKAVLRREPRKTVKKNKTVIKLGGLVIDPDRYEVFVNNNKVIEISSSEFKVLHFLASRPGWVFTRYQIIDAIHREFSATERSIDVLIAGLRKKLSSCSQYIETVRGVGYSFKE